MLTRVGNASERPYFWSEFVDVQGARHIQLNTNGSERARIDSSGNLLVGTTTARNRLTVQGNVFSTPTLGTASGQAFFGEAAGYGMMLGTSGYGYGWIQQQRVDGSATAYDLLLQPVGGNVGIGVTPSAQLASYKSFQFGIGGNLIGRSDNSGIELSSNSYRNSGGNYIYLNTATAASYRQYSGGHEWHNAPSGTAGTAITFTQAMTLDASGIVMNSAGVSTISQPT